MGSVPIGHSSDLLGCQRNSGPGLVCDLVHLLLDIHPDEGLVLVEHGRRYATRCASSHDRLDRCGRINRLLGSVGADEHRNPLAVSPLHGHCMAVQRPVLASWIPDAHGRRTIGCCCRVARCDSSRVALPTVLFGIAARWNCPLVDNNHRCRYRFLSARLVDPVPDTARSKQCPQTAAHLACVPSSYLSLGCHPLGIALMAVGLETSRPAVQIERLSHKYGSKLALDNLSLEIPRESIFGVLGPNGSGKSTLFRLLSTLVPIQSGNIDILGFNVANAQQQVRESIGVVFQSPSLDRKLTARENIQFQAALYGISKYHTQERIDELSKAFDLDDHLDTKVDKLSGGLRRRVELVKGILHRPRLLLLDEPSTGLDPLSRLELWQALVRLQREHSTTIVLTTHLLDEAQKCHRVAIMDQGRLLVSDSPERLQESTGQMVFSIATADQNQVLELLKNRYGLDGICDHGSVRLVLQETSVSPTELYAMLGPLATSITIGRPSLEDVFIKIAGKSFHA